MAKPYTLKIQEIEQELARVEHELRSGGPATHRSQLRALHASLLRSRRWYQRRLSTVPSSNPPQSLSIHTGEDIQTGEAH